MQIDICANGASDMPNGVIFAFGKRYLQQVQAKVDLKYICKSATFNFQF